MTTPDSDQPDPAQPAPSDTPQARHAVRVPDRMAIVAAVVAVAMLFGLWGVWRVLSPGRGDSRGQLEDAQRDSLGQQRELDHLRQRVATLGRSDQISREANRDLQSTLAERDEEIAALRADVAFYERLVGSTAQRRGLTVHALRLQPQNDEAWHFTTTLTQNLNRGAVTSGQLTLTVEGTREGKLEKLAWADLRQQPSAPPIGYSFKYFQQVEGDVFLPAGFTPVRVAVRLAPRTGAAIEQSFTWADATRDLAPATAPATAP